MKKFMAIFLGCYAFVACAEEPIFSLTPQGTLPTSISFSGTATAKYTVTNNTPFTLKGLGLGPLTPAGVAQVTTGTNSPATCGANFNLGTGKSCTLVLSITGSQLQNGEAIGGPEVCFQKETPSRCSVPELGSQLNITLLGSSTLGLVEGGRGSATPLFVQTLDQGNSWTLGTLPAATPPTGKFYSSACGLSDFCIVAGAQKDSTATLFIMQTVDSGATWTIPTLPVLLSTFQKNYFANSITTPTACYMQECIAGGVDNNGDSALLQTLDMGTTWNDITIPDINPPPSSITEPYFPAWNGSSCNSAICLMVGVDENNFQQPIIAQSVTGSSTWNYVDLSGLSTIWDNGFFNSASCVGQSCVSVGYNLDQQYPILAYTQNSGSTWNQFDLSANLDQELTGVSCVGTICVAAGYDTDSGNPPLLLVSATSGVNWATVPVDTLTPSIGVGTFNSTSCSSSLCIVVGTDGNNAPLLVQSTLTNPGWTRIDLSSQTSIGTIIAADCNGSICTAVGKTGNSTLFYQTLDAGTTWLPVTVTGGFPTQTSLNGTTAP